MHSARALRSVLVAVMTAVLALAFVPPAHAATYDAAPASSWIPNQGRVYAIATDATRVYIGGTFTRVRNPETNRLTPRAGLAAFDINTGALDAWNPNVSGRVRALTVEGGIVYAGGLFSSVGGAPATNVAALDTVTGQQVPGFSTRTSGSTSAAGEVRDLAVVDTDLFVAGAFTSVNGSPRVGVAKVDAGTGVLNTGWNARVGGGRVMALAEDPDRGQLLIGGNFKTLAGFSQLFLGAVDYATGARKQSWTPQRVCDTCNVLDLDSEGSDVFAATAGGGGGRAAAYPLTAVNDPISGLVKWSWITRGDGDVQAIDYYDGVVYIGGHFTAAEPSLPRNQVAALDPISGAVQDYAIPFTGPNDPGVWAVKADASALRIGGGFTGISGSSAARYAILPAVTESGMP